ncbi:small subunit processome, U3 snoRNP-associated protein Utp1 [Schizosaccharomyces pombe]|uniref:Periodic tryptophan protein 2 homolog n=1 Tax=Schizosaccharomyces pombe (strain 972 / ATCC 24843) TaxID=284812 RepID=PWP2_SCHPO|nr:putative U3 snoRNP-associated protein Utp1 [Schizosaccharomyces pombe]Q9C1X1.1 RecName: Full=Periodic tryptophan protein 2 homolog [Schizosaccharomyces pombe 972h-]CAC22605.1 U3 snoRNP-associated protein Utp1 (predicted) [Schizosaccharomyces pombe]|eukprot:NP_595343.1 putative U3 snoRNP-associated protein Utp1 [Schizosaccharomyces pombe]
MKTEFGFSNLVGTIFSKGNLVFTPDGFSILSPVGNRVSVYNLKDNTSYTFPFENHKNISHIALSPTSTLLLSVDEEGRCILCNFLRRSVLHYFNFKSPVGAIEFSPNGKFFAVSLGKLIQVWRTPNSLEEREFAPFVLHREYTGHFDDIVSISWSADSRFFISTSKDLTARLHSVDPIEGFHPCALTGHKNTVVSGFFSKDQQTIYTVSKDGALFVWKYSPLFQAGEVIDEEAEENKTRTHIWLIKERHYFNQNSKLRCAAFHPTSNLLVVGFSSGLFGIYELPSFTMLYQLSITQSNIDTLTVNSTGDWIAIGSSKLGQLLVWEWQSESYVLKQQSHYDALSTLQYSSDGQRIITGADDGKIKVWDMNSGFCIVTFTQHTSAVSGLCFSKRGNVLFSSSLDGSVRAWDLIRYRNFRTFTAPSRVQFSCIAVDPSGEIVCAGSQDSFEIFMWSVQTGQLLETLAGHEGPVSSLSFNSSGSLLASGSWDKTVRIWDIFSRSGIVEPLPIPSDVLSLAFHPDGKEVCVASLDGQLTFWNVQEGKQTSLIDGRKDLSGGRRFDDARTAENSSLNKTFTSICYSADGSCVLSAGTSKYVCLYDIITGVLIKKFQLSKNESLQGVQEMLNSRKMTEAGSIELIDTQGEESDLEDRIDRTLPGARRGDLSARKTRPEIICHGVQFSPSGGAFAAATTEGLMIYSLYNDFLFDPINLDMDITPSTTLTMCAEGEFLISLVMALRLNEYKVVQKVYESIPITDVEHVVQELPVSYLANFMGYLSSFAAETPHIEFHLRWMKSVLTYHGEYLRRKNFEFASQLTSLQKSIVVLSKRLSQLSSNNEFQLSFLLDKMHLRLENTA